MLCVYDIRIKQTDFKNIFIIEIDSTKGTKTKSKIKLTQNLRRFLPIYRIININKILITLECNIFFFDICLLKHLRNKQI